MPELLESSFPFLETSAAALLIACFFSVLSCSYRSSGDAGISRLIEKFPAAADRLRSWRHRWTLLLLAIRMGMGLFEIIAVYCAARASVSLPPAGLILLAIVALLLYMIFIRIIPFVLSESYADRISIRTLPFAAAFTRLFYFLIWPISILERRLLHRALSSSEEIDHPSAEDEIRHAMEQADQETLEEDEREIIRSVFEFGETVAREIMTPRVSIEALKIEMTVRECIETVRTSRHSRFPVYHDKMDDVRGRVHVKDLLQLMAEGRAEEPVASICKKMSFVPETMPISDLLKHMQATREQMVLVVDEYGGTAGIACMEDIIEELVGEIEDEYDQAGGGIQARPDGTLLVDSKIPVTDLNEELELDIPESDEYDSIGGFVLEQLGHIPAAGESIETARAHITVQTASPRRIQTLKITIRNPEEKN